nr:hypothetical protein [Chloroflexota bacterium]
MTTVTGSIVGLDGPVDVSASLSGLARWGDDLIDRWDGHRVLRTGRVEGRTIAFRATMMGTIEAPALALTAAAQESGQTAEALARSMFVVAPPEFAELCARDLVIGELDAHHPGVRPLLQPDPLTALVRSISAQQVNLRWAATVRRRIAERYGRRHELEGEPVYSLEASALAQASFDDLRALQLTGAKARAVIGCARAALDGRLDAAELRGLADDAVVE